MRDIFVNTAKTVGCSDLDAFGEVIELAVTQQRSVIDAIIDSKLVEEEDYLKALSEVLRLPWREELIEEGVKPHYLRKICSAQLALKYLVLPVAVKRPGSRNGLAPAAAEEEWDDEDTAMIPLAYLESGVDDVEGAAEAEAGKADGVLHLVSYDPFNLYARQAAAQMISRPIVWEMASRTRVVDALQELYGVGADTFEQILAGREMEGDTFGEAEDINIIDEDDAEASVVKFVNQIIRQALDQRATDIHVEPLADDLRIRFRVDGELLDIAVPDQIKSLQSSVVARLKIMANLDIAERRLPQDGRINLQVEGEPIDVRVATVPTVEGESVSLRLLGQERFTVAKLSLEPKVKREVEQLLAMSNGIVLITGPTGSGKSTTLYSFLTALNSTSTRIVTIEDPVENKLEGVMQIAVKPEINLTFAAGLRSILRADPNIVMIGEIRDLETAEIAVRASLTGHLVFSTLHTNDSIGGISRLMDMGVEPFLVAASVRAFLAQRLVRRLCTRCRRPVDTNAIDREGLGIPSRLEGQIYEAVGCRECRGTGYHGRFAIYEICLVTPKLQDLITHKGSYAKLREQADADGFETLRTYGWKKVLAGETTIEEVVSVTSTELELEEEASAKEA